MCREEIASGSSDVGTETLAANKLLSGSRWAGPSICALAYVLTFLSMVSVLRHQFGFPLDDSWIHQVVARNLAEFRVLGFLPGQLSSGSTSLLWTLILASRALFLPAFSPVIFCASLSAVLLASLGFLLKRLTEGDGLALAESWCIALAPAASGNLLWFGMIGMEHLLFLVLSLCVILAWFHHSRRQGFPGALVVPLFCFLLVITRPEGICLIALLLLFRGPAHRSLRDWATAAAGAGCAAILSAELNWITGHHLTPLTMQGRNALAFRGGWAAIHLQFLTNSFSRMLTVWGIDMPGAVLHGRGLLLGLPLVLFIGTCVGLAVRRLVHLRSSRLLLLCVWAVTVIALYFLKLPTPGHGGRYISVAILLFLPLVFLGLHLALRCMPFTDRAAWLLVGAAGVATALLSIHVWTAVADADIEQINAEHGEIATWIEQQIPPGSIAAQQVAAFDIGRIGYQLGGRLIDLGGLVDSRYQPFVSEHRTADYLEQKNVRYVVLPGGIDDPDSTSFSGPLSLDPGHGAELHLLHTVCADNQTVRLALASSSTALACQRLYSIRYIPR